jgi:GNAT superfamily N-acetyltransferase
MFEIRRGTEADRPAAAEMIRSRAEWLKAHGHKWESWAKNADELAEQIGTARFPVFVLTKDEQIVGMTTATFTVPNLGWTEDEIAEPSVFLQTTVTDPGYTGTNLGMMIAYWALDYAAANGKQWTRRGVLTIGRSNLGLVHYYRLQGWRVVRAVEHPRRPGMTVWSLQRPAAPQAELDGLLRWGTETASIRHHNTVL